MKIGIFSDNFYPELSGISDSIISLSKELVKLDHEINFYAPRYSKENYEIAHRPYEELKLSEHINIIRLPSIPFPAPTKQGRVAFFNSEIISKIKNWDPDIIHSQLFFGAGLLALKASRVLKKPFVGTNHTAITSFSPLNINWIINLLLKYAVWYYNKCDFVTAPSQSVFDEMQKLVFKPPHSVISNPIETASFSPLTSEDERRELKKQFGFNGPTLVFAGRLAPEKNIDIIIKAVAEINKSLPAVELALAGHGSQENSLRALVKEVGVEKNVKFLGLLEKSKLADLYRASEIFVITSTSETQNMTMMQAMATTLPVIGVNARALPEYLNQGNGFIIQPGDFKALAEKAILLFNNAQLRQEMGQKGLDFVQTFTPPKIALAWQEIYKNAIQGYNRSK